MKKVLLFITLFGVALSLHAQAPQGINYQAVARNTAGAPITGTSVNVGFKIREGSNGPVIYDETHTGASTGTTGLFTLTIGQGQASVGTFSSVPWATGTKFLEVLINGAPAGTQQMMSVPYALHAEKVGTNAVGSDQIINGSITSSDLAPGVISPAGTFVFDVSPGTVSSDVRNNRISIGEQGNAETSVTAQATGNYLMLISLEIAFLRTTDDYARIYAANANTSFDYIDQIVWKRDNSQNLTNDHNASGSAWTIVQLNAGTQVNLKVQVSGQQSTQGFNLHNGKLSLIRLN